jgi:hypothetical protein
MNGLYNVYKSWIATKYQCFISSLDLSNALFPNTNSNLFWLQETFTKEGLLKPSLQLTYTHKLHGITFNGHLVWIGSRDIFMLVIKGNITPYNYSCQAHGLDLSWASKHLLHI